jgi:hypothetical protein
LSFKLRHLVGRLFEIARQPMSGCSVTSFGATSGF